MLQTQSTIETPYKPFKLINLHFHHSNAIFAMFLHFQIIDPFVEIEIIGLPVDCSKQQTRVVDDNGMCTKCILQYKSKNRQWTFLYFSLHNFPSTVIQVSTQCGKRPSSSTSKCRRSHWYASRCGIMIQLDEISLDRGLLLSPV